MHASELRFSTSQNALSQHFANLHATAAHERRATPLPAVAAGPVLHIDLTLYSESASAEEGSLGSEAAFKALQRHETNVALAADANARIPYVLCGPQRRASSARAVIAKYGNAAVRTPVLFASRSDDVACWGAHLRVVDATALMDEKTFFHVTPVPTAAKLAPFLIEFNKNNSALTLATSVFAGAKRKRGLDGLTAVLYRHSTNNLSTMLEEWSRTNFGTTGESVLSNHFGSMAIDGHSGPWAAVRSAVASMDCSEHMFAEGVLHSRRAIRLSLERRGSNSTAQNYCALMSLAHLASQPDVESVGIDPVQQSLSLHADQPFPSRNDQADAASTKPHSPNFEEWSELGDYSRAGSRQPRLLNDVAVTALQSGTSGSAPLWAIGVNGSGQFVQVTDTGFDDASCFFRDYESSAFLTGDFNSEFQVARSLWDSPITDKTKRKIVQYISVSLGGTYEYDYENGHGTHCAGSVAGSVAISDADALISGETASKYQGMGPGAKIMAYDFGDNSGNLNVPSSIEQLYSVARDAGSFISSNSWGGGNQYFSYVGDLDEMIYDYGDFLVIVAAGNDGKSGAKTLILSHP